ncbi:MAG: hypothetical protein HWE16_00250 [Gammaproteobacteria bacterium]|nr:hypothetical protein [Gammaproteobacteria bacterium]
MAQNSADSKKAQVAGAQVTQIEIEINPIFDLQENDGWLYSTANSLHIDTKPYIIKRLLPFKEGDWVTQEDLAEAERILRRHRYLRDAKITLQETTDGVIVKVATWENWTLFPTVDYNRQGGETELSYGIKDDNLLGLGIAANIAYFSERDRSGHILSLNSDAIGDRHLRAGLILADNSDGEQVQITLDKPFYRLDDRHSTGISLDSHRQEISIDSNEVEVNRFVSDRQQADLFFGYSSGKTDRGIFRWIGGISHEKIDFENIPLTSVLPENRDLTYPWIAFHYQQDRFEKTKNLYLLEKTEDVQLGWNHYLKLGYNLETSYRPDAFIWQLYSGYFGIWDQQHWYRYALSGHGVHSDDELSTSYFSLFYEHFYRVNDFRTWYLKARYSAADNPYIDKPLSLGGETGLRGYPLEYQHGNRQWLLTLEKRIYPNINLYQLLDVAFVGFIDTGRNYGETPYINQEDGVLASVGLGIRFFLTRSSGSNVINLNFSQPINSDFVKDFDVSIIAKTSF